MKRSAAYVFGVIGAIAGFSQAVTACNTIGDVAPTDASAPDVPHVDAAPPACASDPPPVMTILDDGGNPAPADFSCYDNPDGGDAAVFFPLDLDGGDAEAGDAAPDADMDATAEAGPDAAPDAATDAGPSCTFSLTEFVTKKPMAGVGTSIFFHNDPLAAPDFTGTTDGNGTFVFPAPGTELMGYGLKGSATVKPFVWLDNRSCKAGEIYPAQGISAQSFALLGNGLTNNGEVALDPKKMMIVIGVRDCRYRDVTGGVVELFDDTTGLPLVSGEQDAGHDDYRSAYFSPMGFPDPVCAHTAAQQSLFTAINVPVAPSITARVSGRKSTADTSPVLLGERKLPPIPDTIVVVRPYKIYKNY